MPVCEKDIIYDSKNKQRKKEFFPEIFSSIKQCDCDFSFFLFSFLQVGGSHRTLLYGQAVLFLHSYSGMVSCKGIVLHVQISQNAQLIISPNYFKEINYSSQYFFHSQYLSCLSSSQSPSDKLAFNVGLQVDKGGNRCWFMSITTSLSNVYLHLWSFLYL